MKILSWNRRGINNSATVQALRTWCWREQPDFVFIIESMIDAGRLEKVRNKCGFHYGFCVDNCGNSVGLGLWWRDDNVSLVSYSKNHISIVVDDDCIGCKWYAHGIYGWADKFNKHKTWNLMKSLVESCSFPYVFFGDFNEILMGTEKEAVSLVL